MYELAKIKTVRMGVSDFLDGYHDWWRVANMGNDICPSVHRTLVDIV